MTSLLPRIELISFYFCLDIYSFESGTVVLNQLRYSILHRELQTKIIEQYSWLFNALSMDISDL